MAVAGLCNQIILLNIKGWPAIEPPRVRGLYHHLGSLRENVLHVVQRPLFIRAALEKRLSGGTGAAR